MMYFADNESRDEYFPSAHKKKKFSASEPGAFFNASLLIEEI